MGTATDMGWLGKSTRDMVGNGRNFPRTHISRRPRVKRGSYSPGTRPSSARKESLVLGPSDLQSLALVWRRLHINDLRRLSLAIVH